MGTELKKDGAGNILSSGRTILIVGKIVKAGMVIAVKNLTGNQGLEFGKIKIHPLASVSPLTQTCKR
jgi:hypothetical protein